MYIHLFAESTLLNTLCIYRALEVENPVPTMYYADVWGAFADMWSLFWRICGALLHNLLVTQAVGVEEMTMGPFNM